jgi:hypothetical protein
MGSCTERLYGKRPIGKRPNGKRLDGKHLIGKRLYGKRPIGPEIFVTSKWETSIWVDPAYEPPTYVGANNKLNDNNTYRCNDGEADRLLECSISYEPGSIRHGPHDTTHKPGQDGSRVDPRLVLHYYTVYGKIHRTGQQYTRKMGKHIV